MAINIAQHRSSWTLFWVVLLCTSSIVNSHSPVNAETSPVTKRSAQSLSKADRKIKISELKASFQLILKEMARIEVLWKQGAVSDAAYLQTKSRVDQTQKNLNDLICHDLISPKIVILKNQLRSKLNQKERYKILRDAGAISNLEFITASEQADLAQLTLEEAIENDPTSKTHLNKTKECRDWN